MAVLPPGEDVSNEIMHPINRCHLTTEVNSQDKKSKFNRYLPRKLHSLESGFQGGPASDRIGINQESILRREETRVPGGNPRSQVEIN